MLNFTRRVFIACGALMLAACGGGGEPAPTPGVVPPSLPTDIPHGAADAPLTLIEYAAITCGACGFFNNTVLSGLEEEYVQTGKLRVITREIVQFPAPAEINLAGYAIARCAGADKHHAVLDDLFKNQTGILSAVRAGAGSQALAAVAGRHGLDQAAYEACIANPEVKADILAAQQSAFDTVFAGRNISTPTVYLNGRELTTPESRTLEGMKAILDAELGEGTGE